MKKMMVLFMVGILGWMLSACQGENHDDFDPTPYLTEAYRELKHYEGVSISPEKTEWIFAESQTQELSVLYLFVTFGRIDKEGVFYAMITVYVDLEKELDLGRFIDRIYYDELGATLTSLQGFNNLYQAMLEQAKAFENTLLHVGEIEKATINRAMQGVN